MNQTDSERSAELAGKLFDELVVPLAAARRASGAPPYFPLRPEAGASTYFSPVSPREMRPADLELRVGTAQGLLEALAASWTAAGEEELAALVPRLQAVADALALERAQSNGNVDVLCYTLF